VRVIDFHSHFFARSFFEALAVQAPGTETPQARLDALVAATGIELPPASVAEHLARWTAELDAHGVEHLCTFASAPEEAAAVAEAVALSAGRLSAFVVVDPSRPQAADVLREHLEAGRFRGALLFPAMHHFDIAGPDAARLLGVLDDHAGIVFVHCGLLVVKLRDLLGLPRPYDLAYANPLSIIPAANRFRRVRFVIPHFGAGFFREALMAGTQCDNVFVDTSSSNGWMRTQPGLGTSKGDGLAAVMRHALEAFGPERILFGTDSNVFPAGWRAERVTEQRAALEAAGASTAAIEQVFAGNAARLLGLD